MKLYPISPPLCPHCRQESNKNSEMLSGRICYFKRKDKPGLVVAEFAITVLDAEGYILDHHENFRLTHRGRILSPVRLPGSVMRAVRADLVRFGEGK